ncbi:phenylalanine--tRNA ligase [Marinitoga sp. 1135]|uniref:phenylalanine--tRNA ligase subunit alpha n=1 Tax=unclassified Marinitoga TaxID=2640159 RepID=UPI0009503EB9|nr:MULTISPECIES: phenylalanine--tRNA ligase subunit alpha [unclassified Marinitoga]APT76592.1 phenylalanine--tRNA ligase [Marinitoga sp. 1137]NUU96359.1 phenylalanine--tRNA ligase [Marinitoga sp. 1135]NUU98278.1 phenylalanine--tRNA ligase [Marinitoga sp. 1138]
MNDIRERIIESLKGEIDKIKNIQEFQVLKSKYVGKKGEISKLMKEIGKIEPEKRKEFGAFVNNLKKEAEAILEEGLEKVKQHLKEMEEKKSWVDITLPGAKRKIGYEHILKQTIRDVYEIFSSMGYKIVEGPEIETTWHNFDALNTPEWHPARDMQDTFYIEGKDNIILRTHTSPVQVRTMLNTEPPLAIISPGRVYRKDEPDATHSPAFNQFEGLYIDKNVTVGHLKATLEQFLTMYFGGSRKVLLRPSYFPFVEPGYEVDVDCMFCGGKGCNVCKGTGWIEILGAGLVHPNVLKNVGYDPEKWQGFAFGTGIERIAMLKYGISDMREFYRNDMRFLGL